MPSQLTIESIRGDEQAHETVIICNYIVDGGAVKRFEVRSKLPNRHCVFMIDENDARTHTYTYFAGVKPSIDIPVMRPNLDVVVSTAEDFFRLLFQACRAGDKKEKEAARALKEQEQAALRAELLEEESKKPKKSDEKKSAAKKLKQELALAALQKKTGKACRELDALSVSMGGFSPTTRAKIIKETLASAEVIFKSAINDASKNASLLAELSAAKANFDKAHQTFLLHSETCSETPIARAKRVAMYRAQDDQFNICGDGTYHGSNLFSLFTAPRRSVETNDKMFLLARLLSLCAERKRREEAIARDFVPKDMAI